MATIYLSLSAKADTNPQKEIRVRFKHGKIDQQAKTNIFIPAEYWNVKKQEIIIPNFRLMGNEQKQLKTYLTTQSEKLNTLTSVIQTTFNEADKDNITSDWLKVIIDKINFPEKYNAPKETEINQSFFDAFDEFLQKRKLSDVRENNFMVLKRALQRYELFVSVNEKREFKLELDNITAETIGDIESFLRNEHTLYDEFIDLYKKFPAITGSKRKNPKPQPRGNNTICALFNKLRAFFNWCNDNDKMVSRPFAKYEGCTTEKYGTPYYITLEERNQIADTDLSNHPFLATQRDIFIFQCLIGCRVSDLLQMADANIIGGAIEYIPHKTAEERPTVVRVPLNDRAKELIEKYKGVDEKGRLFPFISAQKYNDDIKEIFRLCGITRMVTVINSITGKEEKRPINKVASSHMARRCFVGNLYKQVADPNLIGALSGHKEGSKAFARYREIDEEMKQDLVKLLE